MTAQHCTWQIDKQLYMRSCDLSLSTTKLPKSVARDQPGARVPRSTHDVREGRYCSDQEPDPKRNKGSQTGLMYEDPKTPRLQICASAEPNETRHVLLTTQRACSPRSDDPAISLVCARGSLCSKSSEVLPGSESPRPSSRLPKSKLLRRSKLKSSQRT